MKKQISRLAALISASLAADSYASQHEIQQDPIIDDSKVAPALLNTTIPLHLAAHRSHSSHRSHQSHRSSSGGGYSAPRTAPSSPPPPPPKEESQPRAEPLGQPARPTQSYPPKKSSPNLNQALADAERRKNIIMRMQLVLQVEGYYNGDISGTMDEKTRSAVMSYKKAKGLSGSAIFDAPTLNSMGILSY